MEAPAITWDPEQSKKTKLGRVEATRISSTGQLVQIKKNRRLSPSVGLRSVLRVKMGFVVSKEQTKEKTSREEAKKGDASNDI